jgi:LPS export ABC transporter protein LptC
MHRLAAGILAVVALFVVLVGTMLVTRSRTVRTEPIGPAPASADLALKQIAIEEETGKVRWRLTADQALVFEREGRTTLRNVSVAVQEPERSWTIAAREGDLQQPSRDLEVRGDVVVTSSDGTRLETSLLRWKNAEQRLWTDAPVRIWRRGTVVDGTALDVNTREEAMTVKGRVRAMFAPQERR